MRLIFRPLTQWTDSVTRYRQASSWLSTLDLLDRETYLLGRRTVDDGMWCAQHRLEVERRGWCDES